MTSTMSIHSEASKCDFVDSTTNLLPVQALSADALPLSAPLGVWPEYISDREIKLTLKKELSWSAADCAIKCGEDVVFVCKGRVRLNYEKSVYTPGGQILLTMKTSPLSIARRTTVTTPDGNEVLTIARVNNKLTDALSNPTLVATFTDHKINEQKTIEVASNIWKNCATLTSSGRLVAVVQTLHAIRSERVVTIAPNTDWLLVTAICICFDMFVMELTSSHGGLRSDKSARPT